jgi:transcriptional regulator with GAF, ATPase, and Fis domain
LRELRNVIERALIVARGSTIAPAVPPLKSVPTALWKSGLVDIQAEHIRSTLERCGWRVLGANGAAERLGIEPSTLESRMARLGISRPPPL